MLYRSPLNDSIPIWFASIPKYVLHSHAIAHTPIVPIPVSIAMMPPSLHEDIAGRLRFSMITNNCPGSMDCCTAFWTRIQYHLSDLYKSIYSDWLAHGMSWWLGWRALRGFGDSYCYGIRVCNERSASYVSTLLRVWDWCLWQCSSTYYGPCGSVEVALMFSTVSWWACLAW